MQNDTRAAIDRSMSPMDTTRAHDESMMFDTEPGNDKSRIDIRCENHQRWRKLKELSKLHINRIVND